MTSLFGLQLFLLTHDTTIPKLGKAYSMELQAYGFNVLPYVFLQFPHSTSKLPFPPLLPHLNNPLDILSPHMTMIYLVPKSPPYESSYLHGRLQSPTLTSPPDIFQIAPHGQPLGLSTGSHLGVTIIISWIILLLRLLNTHLVSMLLRNGFIKQT